MTWKINSRTRGLLLQYSYKAFKKKNSGLRFALLCFATHFEPLFLSALCSLGVRVQNKDLLHFTGRSRSDNGAYEILKTILNTSELLMSYCPTFAKEVFEKNFMMVCLADPEKVDIIKHRELFGNFAIAFKRKPVIKYGANPILYVTTKNLVHIKSQMEMLKKFEDLNKDREWKEELEPFQFTNDELLSFYFTAGLSQELEYKGEKDNYFQSEWRILYQPDFFLGYGKSNDAGMIRPSNLNGKNVGYLKFEKQDVSYLLVPEQFAEQAKNDYPNITVKTE